MSGTSSLPPLPVGISRLGNSLCGVGKINIPWARLDAGFAECLSERRRRNQTWAMDTCECTGGCATTFFVSSGS